MAIKRLYLKINGVDRYVEFDPAKDTLAEILRRFGLTSVKIGCGKGVCGSCSVILNGKVIRSCTKKMDTLNEFDEITTVEGIGTPSNLHPLQEAWIAYGAAQCGFCTPGFIISAYQLLKENVSPTREEVRDWFTKHRNICRCTGYKPIIDAVMAAAKVMRGEMKQEELYTDLQKENGSIYNTHYPRPTALAKVTGTLDYGDDIGLKMPPGTLQVAIVQPKKYSHAKILGIDISEAEKMPGVEKIILASDVKGTNNLGIPIQHPHSVATGFDMPLLCFDKIYNYGDVVALAVADTMDHARAAAAAVKVHDGVPGRPGLRRHLHDARHCVVAGLHRLPQRGRCPAQAAYRRGAQSHPVADLRQLAGVRGSRAHMQHSAHGYLVAHEPGPRGHGAQLAFPCVHLRRLRRLQPVARGYPRAGCGKRDRVALRGRPNLRRDL